MLDIINFKGIAFVVLFLTISASLCLKKKDDKIRILDLIDLTAEYAEKKDTSKIVDLLSDDFSTIDDQSKKDIRELLTRYFNKYKGVVINILSTNIIYIKSNKAEIETDVSLSSGISKVLRKVVRYYGETYRFKIILEKDLNEWKFEYAEWRYISIADLFPESYKMLKKIFPNI
jgi:hypothetical protein